MKTLLIYPPSSALLTSEDNYLTHMPLGLAYLCAYLKSKNHECKILDINMKMYLSMHEEHKKMWYVSNRHLWENKPEFEKSVLPFIDLDRWITYILSFDYDVIGFYMSYSTEHCSIEMAKKIREKNKKVKIIFGGPGCYHENAKQFKDLCDVIVVGEGEITLNELIENNLQSCKGSYVGGIWGGDREMIKDLDSLPFPDFDDIIVDYKKLFLQNTWISVSWIRGCNGNCAFCFDRKFWHGSRMRTAKNIVDELIYLKEKYGVFKFNKNDSTLTNSVKILNEVCDLIIEKDLKIDWYTQSRPDAYLTKELLDKMRKAGCTGLMYGVETGSQKVMNNMRKGYNVKDVERVIKDTYDAHIGVAVTLMVNEPSETIVDYFKTIFLLWRNRKYISYYNTSAAGIVPQIDWEKEPEKYGFKITKTLKDNGYYMFSKPNYQYGEIKKRFMEFLKPLLTC